MSAARTRNGRGVDILMVASARSGSRPARSTSVARTNRSRRRNRPSAGAPSVRTTATSYAGSVGERQPTNRPNRVGRTSRVRGPTRAVTVVSPARGSTSTWWRPTPRARVSIRAVRGASVTSAVRSFQLAESESSATHSITVESRQTANCVGAPISNNGESCQVA